jgi:hypothetical protein
MKTRHTTNESAPSAAMTPTEISTRAAVLKPPEPAGSNGVGLVVAPGEIVGVGVTVGVGVAVGVGLGRRVGDAVGEGLDVAVARTVMTPHIPSQREPVRVPWNVHRYRYFPGSEKRRVNDDLRPREPFMHVDCNENSSSHAPESNDSGAL